MSQGLKSCDIIAKNLRSVAKPKLGFKQPFIILDPRLLTRLTSSGIYTQVRKQQQHTDTQTHIHTT